MNLLENCLERSGIKPSKEVEIGLLKKTHSSPNKLKSSENDVKYYLIGSENTKHNKPLHFSYEQVKEENIDNTEVVYNSIPLQERTNDKASKQIIVCSSEEELKKIHSKNALDPQYKCNLCGRKYNSQSALTKHKIRHRSKDELPFHCMFCDYKSATKRDLLRHHNQHIGHVHQIHKCDYCPKLFKLESSLRVHVKSVHTRETTYQCGICNFSTARRSAIRIHLKTHDNKAKTQIICPICEALFRNKSNLKLHLMTHADAKPVVCNKCDKRFTLSSRLVAHQQAVHDPKKFECEVCQKRFPSIHRLKRHSLTHTGHKPFKCCFCPVSSSTQGNILKHVRNVHQMFHFTFKDIQTVNGEKKDLKKELTPDELKMLIKNGKQISESHLNKLKEGGLSSASLEQLQRERQLKKEAQLNKLREKRERRKKKSSSKDSLQDEKSIRKTENENKRTKVKTLKNRNESFDFSTCDYFLLPRMDDGSYAPHSTEDGGDILPTTTAIQVIWNATGVEPVQKPPPTFPNTKTKKPTRSTTKKSKKRKLKCAVSCDPPVGDRVKLSHSTRSLDSPSTLLEEHPELTFNDKPSMLNHEANDFTAPSANGLVTSLEHLHNGDHLVDFDEGMESPNTVVIASEGITDFERMYYKNLDLYNNFLHIGEDDPHFINPLEPTKPNKDSAKAPSNLKLPSEFQNTKSNKTKAVLSSHQTSPRNCTSLKSTPLHSKKSEVLSPTSGDIQRDILKGSLTFQNDIPSPLVKLKNYITNKNVLQNNFQSNFPLHQNKATISTTTTTSPQPTKCRNPVIPTKKQTEFDQRQLPEEIIMLPDESEGTCNQKISPHVISDRESVRPFMKEITIKNSLSNYRFVNDELDVMAIAEVREENESEVVLVIDSFS